MNLQINRCFAKMWCKKTLLILSCVACVWTVGAREKTEGKVSGSFENYMNYYMNTSNNYQIPLEEGFATNNYLKIKYSRSYFEWGLQYENYLPPLAGYSRLLKGHRLALKYFSVNTQKWHVDVGDFFEQYGNGLVLRTYENRSLGINTALDGLNVRWNPNQNLYFGVFGARQKGFKKDGKSLISGAKILADIGSSIFPGKNISIETGLNYVVRIGNQENILAENLTQDNVSAISGILNFNVGNFSLQTEAAYKSYDPSIINSYIKGNGRAFLTNISYSKKGIGFSAIIRRLKKMDFRSNPSDEQVFMLNFIPANSRQHKYMLANLHPWSAFPFDEFSHQYDFVFLIRKNSALGGKYDTKILANYSAQYARLSNFNPLETELKLQYRDFNAEIGHRWTPGLMTTLGYINLNMKNYFQANEYDPAVSGIVFADITQKTGKFQSVNLVVEHLWAEISSKNWYAVNAEYVLNTNFSVYASDMVNYGSAKKHYATGGLRFKRNASIITLGYGHNRQGYRCSGGICRWIPEYTGLGFTFSSVF